MVATNLVVFDVNVGDLMITQRERVGASAVECFSPYFLSCGEVPSISKDTVHCYVGMDWSDSIFTKNYDVGPRLIAVVVKQQLHY